jgi:CheY-like chemotaxis protein
MTKREGSGQFMRTIFVAGNESEARRYLGQAVRSSGYRFMFAPRNTLSASYIARDSAHSEVLLLDFATPLQNSFDTLQEIRRLRSDLPIIVFSTDDSPCDVAGLKARSH